MVVGVAWYQEKISVSISSVTYWHEGGTSCRERFSAQMCRVRVCTTYA